MHIDDVGRSEGPSDQARASDGVDGAGENASDASRLTLRPIDSAVSIGPIVGEAFGVDVSLVNGAAVGSGLGESSGVDTTGKFVAGVDVDDG